METSLRAGLGNAAIASVLAVLVGCLGCLLRRRPALRHGLWLLVLLKLVTPPVWVVPVAWLSAPIGAKPGSAPRAVEPLGELTLEDVDLIAAGSVEVIELPPLPPTARQPLATRPAMAWGTIAALGWGAGSAVVFGVAAVRVARFKRLMRLGRRAPAGVIAQVEALAGRLGLTRMPEVWWMPGAVSPMLWAAGGRPLLIVPAELWKRLDDRQRVTLLVHELAHLRRRDHWVRGLELVATGLYWWHPAAWWARRELREAEEQCCDAWVVWAFPDAARTYAETLLETVDFLSGPAPAVPTLASGLGQAQHLKRRLTMIMRGTTHRTLNWKGTLSVLALSALMLPISPTWAQKAEAKPWYRTLLDVIDVGPTPTWARKADDKGVELEVFVSKKDEVAGKPELSDDQGHQIQEKIDALVKRQKEELERAKVMDKLVRREAALKGTLVEPAGPGKEELERGRKEIDDLRKEEQRTRAEYEAATARLHQAEARLRKMALSVARPVSPEEVVITAEDGEMVIVRSQKGKGRGDGRIEVFGPGELKIRKDAKADGSGPGEKELRAKKFRYPPKIVGARPPAAADPDRRIAELEKRLDELIGVVKSLKAERDDQNGPQTLPRTREPGQPNGRYPLMKPTPRSRQSEPEKPDGDEGVEPAPTPF